MTWREFIRAHRERVLAVDFFTVETIWLQRFDVLELDSPLSPRTFWNFSREFSSFRRQATAAGERRRYRTAFCPFLLRRSACPGQSPPDARARGFR